MDALTRILAQFRQFCGSSLQANEQYTGQKLMDPLLWGR